MRHWHRNSDPRLRDLERQLSASPNDVELQHALMIAKVRAGELPPLAAERLVPNRPVQPWQWVPASYVLLEAEQLGRESGWQEGKVEIEWSSSWEASHRFPRPCPSDPAQIPAFGIEGERAQAAGVSVRFGSFLREPDPIYYPAKPYAKAFVGAIPTDYERSQIIAGIAPTNVHNAEPLAFLPSRWIPGLDHATAFEAKAQHGSRRSRHGPETRGTVMHAYMPEPGAQGEAITVDPATYTGSYPDVYDPQMLLFASLRVVRSGRHLRGEPAPHRNLQRKGPLLDVRLINRVRIMEKRGRRWV
jgi:hypothetical protein